MDHLDDQDRKINRLKQLEDSVNALETEIHQLKSRLRYNTQFIHSFKIDDSLLQDETF